LSSIPNADGYKMLGEELIDPLYNMISAEAVVSELIAQSVQAYLCPICGRLIVFWKQTESTATFYKKE